MVLTIQDFLKLRSELPAVDVRSEGEYEQGHIPTALNIPILNNMERVAVGTDYKQKGQLEAIKTGFKLVGPRIIDIVNEAEQVAQNRELLVHCWRGGMRSSNFCQFVEMAKIKTHQLKGGYKAYRSEALQSFAKPFKLLVISGLTGSGKTEIIHELGRKGEQIIDLEKLSHHKGSAFGGLMMPSQPTTEQFQNNLFEEILKLDLSRRIWVEDESITIGKIVLPDAFWKNMAASPIVEINVGRSERIARLVKEYGPADREQFLQAMQAITKKLGGQNYLAAKEKLMQGDMFSTIEILLRYYDKAYMSGVSRKKERTKFTAEWNGKNASEIADKLISSF